MRTRHVMQQLMLLDLDSGLHLHLHCELNIDMKKVNIQKIPVHLKTFEKTLNTWRFIGKIITVYITSSTSLQYLYVPLCPKEVLQFDKIRRLSELLTDTW